MKTSLKLLEQALLFVVKKGISMQTMSFYNVSFHTIVFFLILTFFTNCSDIVLGCYISTNSNAPRILQGNEDASKHSNDLLSAR